MANQPQQNVRKEAHELVDGLPENATWDDLMERIYVRQRISAGLRDVEEGRVLSVMEVRRRFGLSE
jgi:hypothetical protein